MTNFPALYKEKKERWTTLVDHGWWFYFERADGSPLTARQYAFWMLTSPLINLGFMLLLIVASIFYAVFVVVTAPYTYFKKSYKDYREYHEKCKQKVWEALKNEHR